MHDDFSHHPAICLSSPDCIKFLNSAGEIVFFNEDGLRLMEIDSLSAVEGIYWPSLWPVETQTLLTDALAGALRTGLATLEAFCPTAKGTPKWWDVTIAATPGDVRQFVVVSRDITEARQAREVERLALERLRLISAANSDVIWDIDLHTGTVWWGDGMTALFGYNASQLGYTARWCRERIHPNDRDRVVQSMMQAASDGQSSWEGEFRFQKADQTYLMVLNRGAITRDLSGRPLRFVGVMQDVSARQAAVDLHKLVAGELGHRMNNILAVISGLFQSSAHLSPDKDSLTASFNGRLQAMSTAQSAVLRGAGLGVDVETLIAGQLAPYLPGKRLLIDGPAATLVETSAQPLALALNELATNALKYGALSTDTGTVNLRWTHADGDLTLTWVEAGGPPVTPPTRTGMGSRLIEKGIPGAEVVRHFERDGFHCTLRLPLNGVTT